MVLQDSDPSQFHDHGEKEKHIASSPRIDKDEVRQLMGVIAKSPHIDNNDVLKLMGVVMKFAAQHEDAAPQWKRQKTEHLSEQSQNPDAASSAPQLKLEDSDWNMLGSNS